MRFGSDSYGIGLPCPPRSGHEASMRANDVGRDGGGNARRSDNMMYTKDDPLWVGLLIFNDTGQWRAIDS